jgi:hypothetical protein
MAKNTQSVTITIEDLSHAEQELTADIAKAVMGGVEHTIAVPTAVGSLDYQRGQCRTDYNTDYQKTTSYGQVISSDGKVVRGSGW